MGFFRFFAGLLQVLVEQNRIRSREVESRLYPDKRAVYKRVLDTWWRLLDKNLATGRLSIKDLDHLKVAKREMMLFADGDVVHLWNEMEGAALSEELSSRERLLLFDRVVRAMRKDLGYDDSNLAEGELFALAIRGDDKDSLLDARQPAGSLPA